MFFLLCCCQLTLHLPRLFLFPFFSAFNLTPFTFFITFNHYFLIFLSFLILSISLCDLTRQLVSLLCRGIAIAAFLFFFFIKKHQRLLRILSPSLSLSLISFSFPLCLLSRCYFLCFSFLLSYLLISFFFFLSPPLSPFSLTLSPLPPLLSLSHSFCK